MKQYPIQFTQLCEILAELQPKQVVRITILETAVSSEASGQIRTTHIVVPITTEAASGHVLMCHIHIGTFEHMATGPMDPAGYASALQKAASVHERVRQALQDFGCIVLGGYIDVPNISNVLAPQPEMSVQGLSLNHLSVPA